MKPATFRSLTFAFVLGGAAFGHGAFGPTSVLYIVNYGEFGSSTGLDLVQGATVNSYNTGNVVDTCIGVAAGDVRTLGYGQNDTGSRFDLFGGPLSGGPYTNTIANSQLHDGTSDGTYNYSVDYVTGDVLRFSRTWTSPTVLFNLAIGLPGAGYITMNATDGSFWISQFGGPDIVNHYSSTGTLIGGFNSGLLGAQGLALDPVDGTLWTSVQNTLYQFDQAGNALQNCTYSVPPQWYGMEFETFPVPEPSSMVVLGVAGLALLRRRAKRIP